MKTKTKRKKITWMGNSRKMEFHRIVEGEDHPPQCNLHRIPMNYRRFESTAKKLREAGFDAAKWCNHFFKSRDNQ